MSNIEYQTQSNIQIECRISNIKLNPTFKLNVEYRLSNSIQHSNRMSNIEYQTQSNIQIECRISNIKLNPTFKSNAEYRISNLIQHSHRNLQFKKENRFGTCFPYHTIFLPIIGFHLGRHLGYIEMLNDARVASLGIFRDNVYTTRINKEKKFKIKFKVLLKFARIPPDYRKK